MVLTSLLKSHCMSSPNSCDECKTVPKDLSHWPACRRLRNYIHHCHLLLLSPKASKPMRNNSRRAVRRLGTAISDLQFSQMHTHNCRKTLDLLVPNFYQYKLSSPPAYIQDPAFMWDPASIKKNHFEVVNICDRCIGLRITASEKYNFGSESTTIVILVA